MNLEFCQFLVLTYLFCDVNFNVQLITFGKSDTTHYREKWTKLSAETLIINKHITNIILIVLLRSTHLYELARPIKQLVYFNFSYPKPGLDIVQE